MRLFLFCGTQSNRVKHHQDSAWRPFPGNSHLHHEITIPLQSPQRLVPAVSSLRVAANALSLGDHHP